MSKKVVSVPAESSEDESEFERFEKFAGKIIRVPKREIDEQREQERKEA